MGRSIIQIYDEIIQEKQAQTALNNHLPNFDSAQTLLADLTTASKVAIWRMQCWIIAVAIWGHEQLFELFKKEIQLIAAQRKPGGHPWYQAETFKFQYGYQLVYNSNKFQYEYLQDDPAARVVKRCAVVEVGQIVRLKVAGLAGNTVVQLPTPEYNALVAYWNQVGLPGVNVVVTSDPADLLRLDVTVFYDPLVMTSTGELILQPGTFPAEEAVKNYISNIDFNGIMVLNKLVDSMQRAEGVVNPVLNSAEAKYGALPYTSIAIKYTPDAGWMELDPTHVHFTYVPANV